MIKIIRKIQRWVNKTSKGNSGNRVMFGKLVWLLTIVVFFVFAGRLSYIVLYGKVQGTDLRTRTDNLYKSTQAVTAKRGAIYDRYGNVIAEDAEIYSIYAVLSDTFVDGDEKLYAQSKDFETLANILHEKLNMKKEDVLTRLNKDTNDAGVKLYQVEFGKLGQNINMSKKQEIENAMKSANVKGLYFESHPTRIYPNGKFSSNFIGKAGPKNDDPTKITGQMGLEASFNEILSGVDGEESYKVDHLGNRMPGTAKMTKNAVDGHDIYTTLDSRVQSYMETLFDQTNAKFTPETLTGMLMDAKTGEILSMSQRPSFNTTTMELDKDKENQPNWRNILVQDMYEPGSTMKLMTSAASINEGQFNPNGTYMAGEIKVYDTTIHDHDWTKNGSHPLTYAQAISWSSNVGMVHLEERLGIKFPEYQKKYMFGESTNSGLISESNGTLPSQSNPVDLAMSSFGQAINATAFQMMRMFSSISNDGTMLQPHFISKITSKEDKTQRVAKPEVLGHPITSDTASDLRKYMVNVVEDPQWGSAYYKGPIYKVPGMHIAVKTGTAQVADPKGGGYLKGQFDYVYSVVILAPAKDPKYVLYLTIKCPSADPLYALSEISNPFLKRVFESQEQVSTATNNTDEKIRLANYEGKEVNEAASDIRREILNPVILGNGDKVEQQSIPIGQTVTANTKILLRTNGDMLMPDVYGWREEELKQLEKIYDIRFEYEGGGTVIGQSVAKDTQIKVGETIDLTMSK